MTDNALNSKVKICGLTKAEEADYLNRYGADYAGFVFYPKSKRNVTMEQAVQIRDRLEPNIQKVAVTVSPDVELAKQIDENEFDILQIHKKLDPEILRVIHIPVWYAFNVADPVELEEKQRFLESLSPEQAQKITGIVVDAANFGSGQTFNWDDNALRWRESRIFHQRKFILAGGLTPENVEAGMAIFHPDVVDVSSGVEGDHGKDKEKIKAFCRNAGK